MTLQWMLTVFASWLVSLDCGIRSPMSLFFTSRTRLLTLHRTKTYLSCMSQWLRAWPTSWTRSSMRCWQSLHHVNMQISMSPSNSLTKQSLDSRISKMLSTFVELHRLKRSWIWDFTTTVFKFWTKSKVRWKRRATSTLRYMLLWAKSSPTTTEERKTRRTSTSLACNSSPTPPPLNFQRTRKSNGPSRWAWQCSSERTSSISQNL